MLSAGHPDRVSIYRRVLELAQKGFDLRDHSITRVAIHSRTRHCPAILGGTGDVGRACPVIMLINGLDSTKEHMYISGFWAELADGYFVSHARPTRLRGGTSATRSDRTSRVGDLGQLGRRLADDTR